VLDQRLLRDNPELISQQLARRGLDVDLTGLQLIAQQERDLEQRRSELQAEGNRIGKEVGLKIKGGAAPHSPEVQELRERGNHIKQQVAVLEEEEKALEGRLREQLLSFPNLPAAEAPDGRSEADNIEVKRWGSHACRPPAKPSRSTGRSPRGWACWKPSARCASPRAASSPCWARAHAWSGP
jgi:seryl-tRNA synthetase